MAQIIAFPRKDKRRRTILVVDQEPSVRELLCSALHEAGFNAFAVPSADEAARMLDRGIFAIDLVFSDADVPGILNGYALAGWVMENKPGLPVLLASGHSEAAAEWTEMSKPYDIALAVHRIRTTLERSLKRRA
jgi:DNA-binding NtrC family response regulator